MVCCHTEAIKAKLIPWQCGQCSQRQNQFPGQQTKLWVVSQPVPHSALVPCWQQSQGFLQTGKHCAHRIQLQRQWGLSKSWNCCFVCAKPLSQPSLLNIIFKCQILSKRDAFNGSSSPFFANIYHSLPLPSPSNLVPSSSSVKTTMLGINYPKALNQQQYSQL